MIKRIIKLTDFQIDFEKVLVENVNNDSKKNQSSFTDYSYTVRCNPKPLFIKVLNINKIKHLYNGDYFPIWETYYDKLSSTISHIKTLALIELNDGKYIDISEFIDNDVKSLLNSLSWEQIQNCYCSILKSIYQVSEKWPAKNKNFVTIGVDTAFWNFSLDGKLIDFHPPRLNINNHAPIIFSRINDDDHYKRTIYRNLNVEGMRLNLFATTVMKILEFKETYEKMPEGWVNQLLYLLLNNVELAEGKKYRDYLYKIIMYGNFEKNFSKHPITILQELKRIYSI